MGGLTTSVWGQSAKPTERWNNMPVERLRQWLCAKHKAAGPRERSDFPRSALHQKFGLVRLTARTASFPWATA